MTSLKDKTAYDNFNYKMTDYMHLRQRLINLNWNDVYKAVNSIESVEIF